MMDGVGDIMEDPENEEACYVLQYKAERMSDVIHCKRRYAQKEEKQCITVLNRYKKYLLGFCQIREVCDF